LFPQVTITDSSKIGLLKHRWQNTITANK
jgi:hypothetical protein